MRNTLNQDCGQRNPLHSIQAQEELYERAFIMKTYLLDLFGKMESFNRKKSIVITRTIAVILFCLPVFGFQKAGHSLEGDKDAIALANKMLETIGGKSIWKEAQFIYVELTGYYAREQDPWDETFWMDLNRPRGRFVLKSETKDQVIAWTPEGGWDMNNGTVVPFDSAHHAFEMAYWNIQPVVVFHRLATGIPQTRVEMGDNKFRFDVFDSKSNKLVAQFAVNMKNEPIKWGSKIGDREFEHVFGPLKKFNKVIQPSWGAVLSGIWRYEHKLISLSTSPPPVTFDPPYGEGLTYAQTGETEPGQVINVGALVRVEAKYVCMGMAEGRLFNREMIPVKIGDRTYYGCCDVCEQRLKEDPKIRMAFDPVSGNRVDKATAVLGALPDGTVLYFENENTFARYSDKRFKER